MMKYVIGVDVGTGSVRAALVQSDGKVIATETKPIRIWNPHPDFYEQSSEDIWEAVVFTVKVKGELFSLLLELNKDIELVLE